MVGELMVGLQVACVLYQLRKLALKTSGIAGHQGTARNPEASQKGASGSARIWTTAATGHAICGALLVPSGSYALMCDFNIRRQFHPSDGLEAHSSV